MEPEDHEIREQRCSCQSIMSLYTLIIIKKQSSLLE